MLVIQSYSGAMQISSATNFLNPAAQTLTPVVEPNAIKGTNPDKNAQATRQQNREEASLPPSSPAAAQTTSKQRGGLINLVV